MRGFVAELVNHLRLTWRLFWDERVRWWQRAVFAIPLVYFLIPVRYDVAADYIPLVGLIDDLLLALLCTYVFVAICPRRAVREVRRAIALSDPDPNVRDQARNDADLLHSLSMAQRLEMYRHPREAVAAVAGVAVLAGLSALGGVLVGVALLLVLGVTHLTARALEGGIRKHATEADYDTYPRVQACLERCQGYLPAIPVRVYVVPSLKFNAYTWGLDRPYSLVLGSRLVEELPIDELTAIVAHELGHIVYEHTFLSSILGGMLYRVGLPGVLWTLVFARWRRFAELSADRVSLLVCGEVGTCVRALVKAALGRPDLLVDVPRVLGQISAERDGSRRRRWRAPLSSRPGLRTRIQGLVDFDAELIALDIDRWLTADHKM